MILVPPRLAVTGADLGSIRMGAAGIEPTDRLRSATSVV